MPFKTRKRGHGRQRGTVFRTGRDAPTLKDLKITGGRGQVNFSMELGDLPGGGKKMPEKVKLYLKYRGEGCSKAEARKKAGLPPSKGRKKWGPGHPLYEWRKKKGLKV